METEITPHPDYIKGYNEGYIIKKYEPELAGALVKAAGKTERSVGLKDGINYDTPEKDKNYVPAFLRDDRLADFYNRPQDPDKDRDIDFDRE